MRAQTLSDAADSKSALAPLQAGLEKKLSNTFHPDHDRTPPTLEGVGIAPQPELDPPAPDVAAPDPLPEDGSSIDSSSLDPGVQRLFVRAYSLVSAALLTSAAVASQVTINQGDDFLSHQATLQLVFFFEIVCVALLARYAPKLPATLAAVLLFVCAAVNGASFTVFLLWIPAPALAYGFFVCALAFTATAAIASWRRIDLSAPRGILLLFGVGIAVIAIVTAALQLDADYWGTSYTGFVIFAALASYYCDDIRDLDLEFDDDLPGWKSAICGALILYLNFINVYLLTLRLFTQSFSSSDNRGRRLRP